MHRVAIDQGVAAEVDHTAVGHDFPVPCGVTGSASNLDPAQPGVGEHVAAEARQFGIRLGLLSPIDGLGAVGEHLDDHVGVGLVQAVAYRILGVATLPVGALADATYARLFNVAKESYVAAYRLARRATVAAAAWACVAGVALLVAAPLLPRLIGDEYGDAVTAVRVLSVVPLLLALQLFAANALSACDAHPTRARIGAAMAALNVGLNLALIPRYSWRGSVAATIVSELVSLGLIWFGLHRVVRRSAAPA